MSEVVNPKDLVGMMKLPLHLIPAPASALQALGHLDGALKYGAWNWRGAGIIACEYAAAAKRHIDRWVQGSPGDPDSGLHELAHAMTTLNIIVDAEYCGMLVDNRPPVRFDVNALYKDMNDHVRRLREQHAGKDPRHLTIKD